MSPGTLSASNRPLMRLLPIGVVAASVLASSAAARGGGLLVVGALLCAAGFAFCLETQRGIKALLVVLPFSGVVGLRSPSATFLGQAGLEAAIVFPLYLSLGFKGASTRLAASTRHAVRMPRQMSLLIILLVAFVVGGIAGSPTLLVGIIGLRGWLIALPMILVAASVGRDFRLSRRLLRIASIAAIPGLVAGLLIAGLLAVGKASLVYRFYGSAAETATAGFGSFDIGGGKLSRVSGLYPFVAAYFAFCLASCVVGYGLWRSATTASGDSKLGRVVFVGSVAAASVSGSRSALLIIPLFLLLTGAFDHRLRPRLIIGGAAGLSVVPLLAGIDVRSLPTYVLGVSKDEAPDVVVSGMRLAHRLTFSGLGTGTDTNASRNVLPSIFDQIGGRWQESFYVKAWLEIGVLGMAVVILLMIVTAATLMRRCQQMGDVPERGLVAAVTALSILIPLYCVKGAFLDQQPMNYYYWFLIGLALAIGPRAQTTRGEPSAAPSALAMDAARVKQLNQATSR